MEKLKFKIGDIIRVLDDKRDLAIKFNKVGYYKVLESEIGFDLYSYSYKKTYTYQRLHYNWLNHRKDWCKLESEGSEKDYPLHAGQFSTLEEFFNKSYRLAKPEEIVLYATE